MKRLMILAALLSSCHHEARPAEAVKSAPAPAAAPKAPEPPRPSDAEQAALGQQPTVEPLSPFDAPAPRIERLANGLAVYVVERKGDGIESVRFAVRGGASTDPVEGPGLAALTAALMETGAGGRNQTELAAAADAIGATLSVTAGQDALVASASGMVTNLAPMVKLLSDVALRPSLAQAEWKHVQEQQEAALIEQLAEPRIAAVHAFRAATYGQNALARPAGGTVESVKAARLANVKSFYASFAPREAALIAVGGAPAGEVLYALQAAFGTWKPKAVKRPSSLDAAVPADRPPFVLVDFPGKPQSVVIVGQPSVPRSSPDYLALQAFNAVLGGSFTSRLNQNLRELHGYTYGASSRFEFGRGPGPFSAGSSVKTDVTGAALGEMLKELNLAATQPMTAADLDKARALLAFQLVETLSHADALAREVTGMFVNDLPSDELRTFVPRLRALTPESLRAAAGRAIDPARMTIAIAGDKAAVLPQLGALKLAAPQLRDATGALVK